MEQGGIAFLGSLIVAVLAIFGDPIRAFFINPRLSPQEVVRTVQDVNGEKTEFYRLILKNKGFRSAKSVRALLTYYPESPKNFIPVPLGWTHRKNFSRNISRGEPAYLDILRRPNKVGHYHFCWPMGTGTSTEKNLLMYKPMHGDLRIEFFEDEKKIGDVQLIHSEKREVLCLTPNDLRKEVC